MLLSAARKAFEDIIEGQVLNAIAFLEGSDYNAVKYPVDFMEFKDIRNLALEVIDKGEYLSVLTQIGSKYGVRLRFLVINDETIHEQGFTPDLKFYTTTYRKVEAVLKVTLPHPPGPGTPYTEIKRTDVGIKKAA